MMRPHIQRRFRTITDTSLLTTMGAALRTIRDQDGATTADLAHVLGKSKATAERYIAGDRAMPFTAFVRGCQEWDGRFADGVLGFAGMRVVPIEAADCTDQHALADLCDLAARLALALQDGIVTDAERAALTPMVQHVIGELGRVHQRGIACLASADTS